MYDEIIYCHNVKEARLELGEEFDSLIAKSRSVFNDNKSLTLISNCDLDFNNYETLYNLGSYPEIFANEQKHSVYKSVYSYDTPIITQNEDGTQAEHYKPQMFMTFARPMRNRAIPQEPKELTAEELQAMEAQKLLDAKNAIDNAIEAHLSTVASEWGYKSIDRAISYITSDNSEWANEGLMFQRWRDAVWAYVLQELVKIESGQREMPSVDDVILELPKIEDYQGI